MGLIHPSDSSMNKDKFTPYSSGLHENPPLARSTLIVFAQHNGHDWTMSPFNNIYKKRNFKIQRNSRIQASFTSKQTIWNFTVHGHSNFGFIILLKKCNEAWRLSLLTWLTSLGGSSCRSMALCSTMYHNYHNYEYVLKNIIL